MFKKVMVANRGAIACRIFRTLKQMQVASLAVYSTADKASLHVSMADEAIEIGPPPAAESYLDHQRILAVAQQHGVDAIHPGYGFLSENAEFAEACANAGIAFIGPTPQQMRDFGLKHTARQLAADNGLPLLPGTGLLDDLEQARSEALRIGYPVMLKSTAGGGGIGMQLCWSEAELVDAFHSVERLASANFSQGGIFLEKYIEQARHIEVQLFGDGKGAIAVLGERDCSVQRRNQKVVEETPAPGLSARVRNSLMEAAGRLGRAVNYQSAGTVEYILDAATQEYYFLEVNTRLQVEHGVTEMVSGVDLVEWMLRIAAGESLALDDYVHQPAGCAIQARLYAEDPGKTFQPSAGLLTEVEFSDRLRVDSWIEPGIEVPAYYDPMLAKLIAHGQDREQTIAQLNRALDETSVHGIETNLAYLQQVINSDTFAAAQHTTRFLDGFAYLAHTLDVLSPGTQSFIVDYPGRTGHWDVGVPPSGPMDPLAFQLANRLVGNDSQAAGLEMTITGVKLRFNTDAVIALAGAQMKATLDNEPVSYLEPVAVKAGSVLKVGAVKGEGSRTYLAVRGGFDVPLYMGSRTTFTLGKFGGHAGRALLAGDVLRVFPAAKVADVERADPELKKLTSYGNHWDIHVMYGPHGAPDFFTSEDIDEFFATDYEVHYNSSRSGVRLIGPKPRWARNDGGEAGLHPSNIHDNAYAIGAIDFTGDMPIILGPDGPSLGGFVCPATIVAADLWKMGQLKPGDKIRFHCISVTDARALFDTQQALIASLKAQPAPAVSPIQASAATPVIAGNPAPDNAESICYRQAGDNYLLIEFGPLVLDLELRFRAHAFMQWLGNRQVPGLIDLTPGIRSLQLHYDSSVITQAELLHLLQQAEQELQAIDEIEVPSRIVHLPLSWDDPSTRLAIDKYMQSVRADAPWCPSNIEFIRRINGLESIQQVRDILFNANYLVMGLGDVYLGAPVATPLDPRHRLVTTKYNPARTWTPENAVGIGGAYLCVYGMEGPGGYQFVGRTVQMWNHYRQTNDFTDGKQWLLRFFDQLKFYEVTAEALAKWREDFPLGRVELKVEDTTLKLSDYRDFLAENQAGIDSFKQQQQAAFEAERQRWEESGQAHFQAEVPDTMAATDAAFDIPAGCMAIASPVSGSIWSIAVQPGQQVASGDELIVVEAMKMEIPIEADESGVVEEVLCAQGNPVSAGQAVIILRTES